MPDIAAARPASGEPIASAWGGAVHDQLEGIQSGIVNVAMGGTAAATGAVTFARPYASVPVVIATGTWVSGGSGPVVSLQGAATTSGVTFRVSQMNGATSTNTYPVNWIAIGTPA